jgi:VWFA-related protein
VFLLISSSAWGQVGGMSAGAVMSSASSLLEAPPDKPNLWPIHNQIHSEFEMSDGFVSMLDLKAPGKAVQEYSKGRESLLRKNFESALRHLTTATSIYPNYVAAHNALGATYLELSRNDQARDEFARAVALDDHLPLSYVNLGYAELALQHYPAAEQSMLKAATIAPLDLKMLTALAYGQYMNHHFVGVIQTAHRVRQYMREGSGLIHFFAAAAWEAQHNFAAAEQELKTLLKDDARSPAAPEAQQMMAQLRNQQALHAFSANSHLKPVSIEVLNDPPKAVVKTPSYISTPVQQPKEVAEPASASGSCRNSTVPGPDPEEVLPPALNSSADVSPANYDDPVFRAFDDEVMVFFSAVDHGKPVTDLRSDDLRIHDNHLPAAAVTSLRNESRLPLRVGVVLDTSDSISYRFSFEQRTARDFLENVANGPGDLSFVVGFSTNILLAQDFTSDQKLLSHSIQQLAPTGGTSLWDAVDFAAEKLASHPECQPVARLLFVISDGEDNSSYLTAQKVINRAELGQVSIYVVTTRDAIDQSPAAIAGEHALKMLADLSGGSLLDPGLIHTRKRAMDLQQVVRNRYFVSYKPDAFKPDGKYRPIEIAAEKDGHKLRIYARKGYFASTGADSDQF